MTFAYRYDENGFLIPSHWRTPYDGIQKLNKKRRQPWRLIPDFSGSTYRHRYMLDAAFSKMHDILYSDSEARQRILVGATPFGTSYNVYPYVGVKEWSLQYQSMGGSNMLPATNKSLDYDEGAQDWLDMLGIRHNFSLILLFSDGEIPLRTLGSTVMRIQRANPDGPRSVLLRQKMGQFFSNLLPGNREGAQQPRGEYLYQVLSFYVINPESSERKQKAALKTLSMLSSDGTAAKVKASNFADLLTWFSERTVEASLNEGGNGLLKIENAPKIEGVERATEEDDSKVV